MTPAAPREVPKHEWQHTVQTVGGRRLPDPASTGPRSPTPSRRSMYAEVKRGVIMAGVMRDVYALVIEGVPGAFATGGDLGEFLGILELPEGRVPRRVHGALRRACRFAPSSNVRSRSSPRSTACAWQAGLLVASTSDVVVATPRSRFGVPEAKVGLADPYCASILPLSIGLGRARYLMITADQIDAEQAYEWGIVHKVVEEAELENAVQDMLQAAPSARRPSGAAPTSRAPSAVPRMSVEAVLRPVMSAQRARGIARLRGEAETRIGDHASSPDLTPFRPWKPCCSSWSTAWRWQASMPCSPWASPACSA